MPQACGAAQASAAGPREAAGETTPTAAFGGTTRRSRPFSFERVQSSKAGQARGTVPAGVALQQQSTAEADLAITAAPSQPPQHGGGSSSGGAAISQAAEPTRLEHLQDMVELAESGCRVFWPPELTLAEAKRLLAEQLRPPQQHAEAVSDTEYVLSSQELEFELNAQLDIEGWL